MSFESITIPVDLLIFRKNLSIIKVNPVSENQETIQKIYGKYLMTSLQSNQKIIFEHKLHPVFQGFVDAYRNHRPLTISPDIIWLLIIQGFSHHVEHNSKELRSMFVNFEGQKQLHVKREDLNFYNMTYEDWQENIFPEFVQMISECTGQSITNTLTPNFTTTTPISLAVGQISIMSSMKNYFKYKLELTGCGLPYVTIEGSLEDWEKILTKLEDLKQYKLDWWVNNLTPIISKIIDTKKGNVDKKFWKSMIRIKDGNGMYNPGFVDGWFTKFFPYTDGGDQINGPIYDGVDLPYEMLSVPFELTIKNDEIEKSYDCKFVAGFVGLSQDKKSSSLKPEIGWFIREVDLIEEKHGRLMNLP